MEPHRKDCLYSVVVPTYNTSQSLESLARRIRCAFTEVVDADYEILFVDDGSPSPDTWPTLRAIRDKDPNVRIIRLTRNYGQQAATLCGLQESRGDWVFTMDDDGQHFPEDIPAMIEERDHDIVVAAFPRKKHSAFKRWTSTLKDRLIAYILQKPPGVRLSPFRMLQRNVVEGMLAIYTPNPFIPALMLAVSTDVVNVRATHGDRVEGETTYTLGRMTALFKNLLINNSSLLLTLIGRVGLAFSALSFVYGATIAFQKLAFDTQVEGWASLMVSVSMIGGLLLFSMGVIGEYLIRIIEAVEKKPTYWVREREG